MPTDKSVSGSGRVCEHTFCVGVFSFEFSLRRFFYECFLSAFVAPFLLQGTALNLQEQSYGTIVRKDTAAQVTKCSSN